MASCVLTPPPGLDSDPETATWSRARRRQTDAARQVETVINAKIDSLSSRIDDMMHVVQDIHQRLASPLHDQSTLLYRMSRMEALFACTNQTVDEVLEKMLTESVEAGVFDGFWRTENDHSCHVQGHQISWIGHPSGPMPLRIIGNTVWVESEEKSEKGTLTQDGLRIEFDDGDKWTRVLSEEEAFEAFNRAARESACSQGYPDRMTSEEDGTERRVLEDWDATAYGSEYLSLTKGELLCVKQDREGGWAFGYSIQQSKEGWFPPAYIGDAEAP